MFNADVVELLNDKLKFMFFVKKKKSDKVRNFFVVRNVTAIDESTEGRKSPL